MTELSKEEMLKEIVQRMIDGGWKPSEEYLKKSYKEKLGDYIIEINHNSIKIKICTARVLEQVNRYGDETSVPLYDELFNGSLPALLADPEAMKSLVGYEDEYCMNKNCEYWSEGNLCEGEITGETATASCMKGIIFPAHIYHPMQALKLMLEGGDAIDYLYKEMRR